MTTPQDVPPPVFPRSVTWFGIVILGSALTSTAIPQAVASGPALHSATIEWSGADLPNGVISGGAPSVYTSGVRGWGAAPFFALGTMGLEWETPFELARREPYLGSESNVALVPGGVSAWTSNGLLFPRPNDSVDTTSTISIDGNRARWSIELNGVREDTMSPFRFFWVAGLVDSYESVYSSPAPGVVVISDGAGQHPTLVLKATSTSGIVQWGGSGIYTADLAGGERQPTLYVHSTSDQNITVAITLGIVDSDPCERSNAIGFASATADSPTSSWPTLTSCMGNPSWEAQAGESTVLTIPLNSALPALGAEAARELSISGLPSGVSWERLANTEGGLSVRVLSDRNVPPGDYSLSFSGLTTTTTGGVTHRSQPLVSGGNLAVSAPAEIAPPSEPEPIPEEPSLENDLDGPEEVALASTDASAQSTPPATDSRPSEQSVLPAGRARLAVPTPDQPERPIAPFAIARPQELPLATKPPAASLPADAEGPPEPTNASSWVGLSLLTSLVVGALIAVVRRRKEPAEE